MNKAFVREPDDTGQRRCPRCDSLGVRVYDETLNAHLNAAARETLSDVAFFCPFPRCEVAYFDDFERHVSIESMAGPTWPKHPSAPLCACFGFSIDDLEHDIREGGVTRVRELLAKSKSPEARCRVTAPSGQCCMPEVQKLFMRMREANRG